MVFLSHSLTLISCIPHSISYRQTSQQTNRHMHTYKHRTGYTVSNIRPSVTLVAFPPCTGAIHTQPYYTSSMHVGYWVIHGWRNLRLSRVAAPGCIGLSQNATTPCSERTPPVDQYKKNESLAVHQHVQDTGTS